ncbi:MAG: acetyl/propionyl-CoA carboxylase alpha subunit/acetyl-CoA carboxylase alpha subunit [Psychromonas sp.]|jgi:acetyl/propionyl-CoA carboxylase alpha subunit/acetyl-CoA carboxylase alpha subunit/acetyl-CoA carboxylase beta subunit|uniref:ATP-binding protein n=1 Tax=Psychromonas sp. TaxID=1884585 RepID=UPI0039E3196E
MPVKPSSSHFEVNKIADPLFLHAEHIAKDFSLFPDNSLPSNTEGLEGLIDRARIKSNLSTINELDVDAYIARTVQPAEDNKRPGTKKIVSGFNGKIVTEKLNGAFYSAEMELDFGGYMRRIGIIGQERSSNNGAWMPEHHLAASKAIRKFADLSLPIVFLIDTPGADAGEEANSQNQAHSISQMITESANVDVPTVGIVVGVGYSGGAIPLATANILLSVRDGIFNTIQPKGLQSIARKYNLSWQECAQSVGVSPEELYENGCIDGIVDYSPVDQDERQHNLQKAIVSSILSIEATSVHFVREYPDILEHYNRSLMRYLDPSNKLVAVENASDSVHLIAKNPTVHNNAFGTTYRYMRYLTLRSRIKAIQMNEYGRLSKLTEPEGDLRSRIEADRKQVFVNWLENPDKIIYDDTLNKNWKKFIAKREDISVERNMFTKFILGEPQQNYDNARSELLINLTWSLYNRWKVSAENNFRAVIEYLEDEKNLPLTDTWPELSELTAIDVVAHKETRECFIVHCRHMLVFNALYDNTMGNLASIAKEAMATKELSRNSVSSLVRSSLKGALNKVSDDDYEQLKSTFNAWLKYFTDQSGRGDILAKVEEWKSVGYPQMNSSLFVILTYIFEKLLPEYYKSRDSISEYSGAINPVRIGRRKDFWNRLTMGYQDLLIQAVLREEKNKKNNSADVILGKFFTNFKESKADLMTANLLEFPGFRLSIEDALDKNIKPCGLITGVGEFKLEGGTSQKVGVAVSNLAFQAGAFDMASAEKFCALLVECAKHHFPVVAFISSGGMQTKEGASALFSMAVVNDRITRFIRDNDLPVVMFGYGDCTGGAQASFVTHPLAQTYYLSGTNMPFAGQMVVPAYLPSTATLSNYLSRVPGAMDALVINPFSEELDKKLSEIDENMPLPVITVEETIQRALNGFVPVCDISADDFSQANPRDLMTPVKKVLIHARGCTAVKLIRIAQKNNIKVVLVASDPDMTSVPADMLGKGDKLVCLGGNTSDESYLNASSVLKVAEYEEVDALHPGIGFLSESPHFADLCVGHNINFVGPSMNSMLTMGNKSNAIKTAQDNGVPVVPGSHGILTGAEQAFDIANTMGYPVLLKAVNGGGGKGILVIEKAEDMFAGFNQVSAEARGAFGNGDLYLEKYITSLRHIEVQLLRDKHCNTKVLGIRDCSVQRNNQKVVEESESTMLPARLEAEVLKHTAALADAVDYMGAGTVEFIYDLDQDSIYFMEMNTRLQVEHPVTEATSGIDIVKAQYDIASGKSIAELKPEKIGYAIEVRVTAEKAALDSHGVMQLLPHPGKVVEYFVPEQDDIEVMSMIAEGKEVSPYYDSLVAQFICHGKDRNDTVRKLLKFLDKVVIRGIATNIPLLKRILKDETFLNGVYDTTYLPKFMAKLDQQVMIEEMEASASTSGSDLSIKVDGSNELKVIAQSAGIFYRASSPAEPDFVSEGDIVDVEQTIGLMEAMKMFSPVTLASFNRQDSVLYDAQTKFRVERIINTNGQQVSSGDLLYIVTPL